MIDFLLGLYLAGLLVRGWLRGFVRELFDLLGLVLGVVLAFRLSGPIGDFLSDRFGATPEWARIGAGIVLFILVGMALGVFAHWLGRVVRLPGLNLANRLAGSALATAWGLVLVLVAVTVLRALPAPAAVDEALDDSRVVSAVAGSDSVTRRWFVSMAGDQVLEAVVQLESLIGERRVILEEDQRLEIEPADPSELAERPGEADRIFRMVNASRIEEGLSPLVWSQPLADVALAHAREMYVEGYLSHHSPTTGNVADRVDAAGIRLVIVGENLALAASARAVHEGLMDSPGHRANILHREFDRVGVGAIQGPLGLMVVQVFGG